MCLFLRNYIKKLKVNNCHVHTRKIGMHVDIKKLNKQTNNAMYLK